MKIPMLVRWHFLFTDMAPEHVFINDDILPTFLLIMALHETHRNLYAIAFFLNYLKYVLSTRVFILMSSKKTIA